MAKPVAHLYLSSTPGPFEVGDTVSLVEAEAHHAATVSRLGIGEKTLVTDGQGSLATTRVVAMEKGLVTLEVLEASVVPREEPQLWLAQALAKGDRDEAAIQMATELGVDGVIPFAAARSVSVWRGDKKEKGLERWRKIVIEASKQSLRPWFPEVLEPVTAKDLAGMATSYDLVVLVPGAPLALSQWRASGEKPVLLVVGPEGGLEHSEIDLLVDAGAAVVRLGETVLRTSSAGPAALAVLNLTQGRW